MPRGVRQGIAGPRADPTTGPMLLTSILVGLVLVLTSLLVLLTLRLRQHQESGCELSAVTRQHIDLFQGGQLNQAAVESAKARFRALLERGEHDAVEASMRPGTQYVIQVRALTELGTEDAGRILERQLQRRLTEDALEQSWYWIDLANGLRCLNRDESLPFLLRCAESSGEIPLSQFFAAETVCFFGFAGYLRHLEQPLGRAALRVLHRSMEGLRLGLPPHVVIEGRLGEALERVWDHRPPQANALVAHVFHEALRLLRRVPQAESALADEPGELEAYQLQIARLEALHEGLEEYLDQARGSLPRQVPRAAAAEERDLLRTLDEVRAEAGNTLLPLLIEGRLSHPELAVQVLRWSREPVVGPALCRWAAERLPLVRRTQATRRVVPPRRPSVPSDFPYEAILRTLRGHASPEIEGFLVRASHDWDPTIRAAAVSSLGWWEPFRRAEVLPTLQQARRDPNPEVRQRGRAALARLGELQALQWYRQAMSGEDLQRVQETAQAVADEGLTLLWPELDRLADHEELDVAQPAREALERFHEEMDWKRD